MKKRILITGGTGFIGKTLVDNLSATNVVFAPSRSELNLFDADIVMNYVKFHNIEIIIHTAISGGSQKGEEVENSLETNLRMLVNISRCSKVCKKIIHFGSGAEYDKSRPIVKIKEDDFGERVPPDRYGFYKYLVAKYISNDKKIVNLRLFGIFGPGEDYRYRFISNTICRILNNMPIKINRNVYFDYLYCSDLVKIVEYFIQFDSQYRCYNIGSGNIIDLVTIANKIKEYSGYSQKIMIQDNTLNNEYTCDISRLKREFLELNFTPIDVALKQLYKWYESNIKNIDISKL